MLPLYRAFPCPRRVFALIGNTLLYYTVVFLWALTSLVANRCAVPAADHILAVLCYMPIQMAFKALGDLAVTIEDLAVMELTA